MVETVLVDGGGRSIAVRVATTRWERLRGLLGPAPPPPGTGLLLPGATSVHTIGMRFPVEVAWLDDELRVVEVRTLPPGRVALPRRGARHVLELPAGTGLAVGARLRRPPASRVVPAPRAGVEEAPVLGYTRGAAPGAVGPQGRGHAPIV